MKPLDLEDRYLDLDALSNYSGLSVRRLRGFLRDPLHPLPHFKPGGPDGKVLVRKSEFDQWIERHRQRQAKDLDRVVEVVLAEFHG